MSDRVFLDTNILLYAFCNKDEKKQAIAKTLVLSNAVISAQVVNEVAVNLLKKFNFSEDQIQEFVASSYNRYEVAGLTYEVFLKASGLRQRYLLSYYDSIIVSAAITAGCSILYSEDMQNNLLIDERLRILNPFNSDN